MDKDLQESPVRVMSFNVRGSFRDVRKRNAWRNRAELNIATIERYAPDVIGLQEAQRGNLGAYRKHLPHYAHIRGPRYGNAIPHDFNTILFDSERLEPLDSGGFWLSVTPERYSRSWETRVARSATWVLFRMIGTGLSFLHLNTHLDHVSALARREGSKLIVSRVVEISDRTGVDPPAILTGDFNSRPGNRTHKTFTESGFADTYLAAGNEEGANTFHAFRGAGYRDAHGPRRIDWIFLKDAQGRLRVESHRIIHDADESSGLYPSDHYPILADFSISAFQHAPASPPLVS
ncbi:MAG: endonuclease/exonuclease/phosphatase family protein [Actinomycetota bacterium]|nr:endonuclease/exonuclease/phosphatase family protein [Actinomycetota bacterium]